DTPHRVSSRWFRFADNSEAVQGLPAKYRMGFYGSAVIGMPRNLLFSCRSNLPVNPLSVKSWQRFHHAENFDATLGALTCHIGYNHNPDFIRETPKTRAQSSDVCVYSSSVKEMFQFAGPPTHRYQLHFARKLAALAQKNGTSL